MSRPTGMSGRMWRGITRRRGRTRLPVFLAGAFPALLCAMTSVWRPPIILLWNVSASAPRGLYLVLPVRQARRGETLVAWLPAGARALAARRDYLPPDVPLVKAVAAAAGDLVCAQGSRIFINRRFVALRRSTDKLGRPLPRWSGCLDLKGGDALLLSNHPWSFDGRYFGITRDREIIGRARILWRE